MAKKSVGRPALPKEKKTTPAIVMLPAAILALVDKLADEQGLSRSEFMRRAIMEKVQGGKIIFI